MTGRIRGPHFFLQTEVVAFPAKNTQQSKLGKAERGGRERSAADFIRFQDPRKQLGSLNRAKDQARRHWSRSVFNMENVGLRSPP